MFNVNVAPVSSVSTKANASASFDAKAEAELVAAFRFSNDPEEKKKIVGKLYEEYEPITKKIARSYLGGDRSAQYEDYCQEGFIGFRHSLDVISLDKLNGSNEYFRYYAISSIRHKIIDYNRNDTLIKQSRSVRSEEKRLWHLLSEKGIYLDDTKKIAGDVIAWLSEEMDISEEHVIELLTLSNQMSSVNCPLDCIDDADGEEKRDITYCPVPSHECMVLDDTIRDKAVEITLSCASSDTEKVIIEEMLGLNEDETISSINAVAEKTGISAYKVKTAWKNLVPRIAAKLMRNGITPGVLKSAVYGNDTWEEDKHDDVSPEAISKEVVRSLTAISRETGALDAKTMIPLFYAKIEDTLGDNYDALLAKVGIRTNKDVEKTINNYITGRCALSDWCEAMKHALDSIE